MVFKRVCPTCKEADKIIKRCRNCFKLCCSNCSIDKNCIDCDIELKKESYSQYYFDIKNKIKVEHYV